jgi:hypothetical protein
MVRVFTTANHPVNEDATKTKPSGAFVFHSPSRKMKGKKTGGSARIFKALSRPT